MMEMDNKVRFEGRVYDHELSVKQVKNPDSANYGKDFINGKLSIAVDDKGMNVVDVHFSYVTPLTKGGKSNATFNALKKIIETNATWVGVGPDQAIKVCVENSSLELNDFYSMRDETFASPKRHEGGFVSIIGEFSNEPSLRNKFTVDMLITSAVPVEANVERNIPEHTSVRGAIFNYRKELMPIDFVVEDAVGREYFENLGATNATPVLTKVWGRVMCITEKQEIKEESAFGEASVSYVERNIRKWVLTGSKGVPYEFGDEKTITAEEVTAAQQAREIKLAKIKQDAIDYAAKKESTATSFGAATPAPAAPSPSTPINSGGFNF